MVLRSWTYERWLGRSFTLATPLLLPALAMLSCDRFVSESELGIGGADVSGAGSGGTEVGGANEGSAGNGGSASSGGSEGGTGPVTNGGEGGMPHLGPDDCGSERRYFDPVRERCLDCKQDDECATGICINFLCSNSRICTSLEQCGDDEGLFCDQSQGVCVACSVDLHCSWLGADYRCRANTCIAECSPELGCEVGLCASGQCADCVEDTDCPTGAACTQQRCLMAL